MDILITLSPCRLAPRAGCSNAAGALFDIPLRIAGLERRWIFLSRITLNSSTTRAAIILRSATLPWAYALSNVTTHMCSVTSRGICARRRLRSGWPPRAANSSSARCALIDQLERRETMARTRCHGRAGALTPRLAYAPPRARCHGRAGALTPRPACAPLPAPPCVAS